jgi:hypothetical protein
MALAGVFIAYGAIYSITICDGYEMARSTHLIDRSSWSD